MNYEYEDDNTSYFDSLAGPMNYETHQAAYQQRLTAPIRKDLIIYDEARHRKELKANLQ